ncbi:pentatricopeptide repeat-containing protein At4g26680, mitochondrial [Cryptomeria japonica]|uniref:pentatricopeptide repeat-containing protein At4g26680, mitochondrial n=1 Tax=Cryptomeria japonica TaxID=3369 RepID=UPI0027D9DFC1|nr:pentatricopeptide repeat-containing protein At4g26680, mitochondrial [Cryptomeria japonica]
MKHKRFLPSFVFLIKSSVKLLFKISIRYSSQRYINSMILGSLFYIYKTVLRNRCLQKFSTAKISTSFGLSINFNVVASKISCSERPNLGICWYHTSPSCASPSHPISKSSALSFIYLPRLTLEEEGLIQNICAALMRDQWDYLEQYASQLNNGHLVTGVLQHLLSNADLSLRFFIWTEREKGVKHSIGSYCAILEALVRAGRFIYIEPYVHKMAQNNTDSVFEVLKSLLKTFKGWDSAPFVFDLLYKSYLSSGMVKEALEAFHQLKIHGYLPTVLSCNKILSGLVKLNCLEHAWKFYREMIHYEISPSRYTLNIMINSLCKWGEIEKAMDYFSRIVANGFVPDIVTFNPLIEGHCSKGNVKEALTLFNVMYRKGLKPDAITCIALITGYCKAKQFHEARRLLKKMPSMGLTANLATYNMILNGFCEQGMLDYAFQVRNEMVEKGFVPNLVTYTALIQSLCKKERTRQALRLLKKGIAEDGLVPDCVIYTILIHGYCKQGKTREGLWLQNEMLKRGLMPDTITYTVLINGFSKKGEIKKAKVMFDEMLKRNLVPNCFTYTTLIYGLCKKGDLLEASELLDDLRGKGFALSTVPYNALIDGFCKNGEMKKAESLKNQMMKDGLVPDSATYNILIAGHCKKGNIQQALHSLSEAKDGGFVPNAYGYDVVINGLCKEGNKREVKQLFKEMLSRDLAPTNGTCSAVVSSSTLSEHSNMVDALEVHDAMDEKFLSEADNLLNKLDKQDFLPDVSCYHLLAKEC